MIQKYPTLRFVFDRTNKATKYISSTVYIEILYKRNRKYINTGVKLCKGEWSKNKVVGRLDSIELNKKIELLYSKIYKWIISLQENDEEFSFQKFSNFIEAKNTSSFVEFMRERINERTLTDSTKKQHLVCLRKIEEFKKIEMFSDLTTVNIVLFDDYLRKTLNHQPTIHGYHKRLKTYIKDAIQRDYVKDDPYLLFKVQRGSSTIRRYLTHEELNIIENTIIADNSISKVRDLFVFQCYTGMSYSDLIKFNWNECFIEDGDYYIRDIRFKTGVEYFLMILPPAMDIIKKFNNKLPVISNQQYNLRLKVVGQMCGIEKSLTTHVARHTFATTITLSNGVPISIVSKMLGHTKISTTEQYAKILNKNVKDQFLLLKEKIKRGK